jgi:hypothetical protein
LRRLQIREPSHDSLAGAARGESFARAASLFILAVLSADFSELRALHQTNAAKEDRRRTGVRLGSGAGFLLSSPRLSLPS